MSKLNPINLVKLVAGSFSLSLIVSFVAFETFLDRCPSHDLQFLGPNQLKDRPPVLTKLNNYDAEHGSRPTIILVGSSLAQYASNLCDFGQFGSPDLNKDFASYSKFRYLDKALAAAAIAAGAGGEASHIETANLSNSGTMISEDFLIIKEAFRQKNPPRAVVLEIGPRDFIDNMTPDPYRSRLSQVLAKKQEPFAWRTDRTVAENLDITAEKTSLFYSMKGELHDCLVKMACDTLNHPASVYQATLLAKLAPKPDLTASAQEVTTGKSAKSGNPDKSAAADPKKGTMKFGTIDDAVGCEALKEYSVNEYKGRYLPINEKKWPVEVDNLKQLIAFCRSKSVPLIIVNMPLTKRNLDVLPQDFRDRYERTIAEICTPRQGDKNLAFVDLRHDDRFGVDDFRDTVHMRSPGGKKLADLLAPIVVSHISGNPDASAKFAGKSNNLY